MYTRERGVGVNPTYMGTQARRGRSDEDFWGLIFVVCLDFPEEGELPLQGSISLTTSDHMDGGGDF